MKNKTWKLSRLVRINYPLIIAFVCAMLCVVICFKSSYDAGVELEEIKELYSEVGLSPARIESATIGFQRAMLGLSVMSAVVWAVFGVGFREIEKEGILK